MRITKKIREEAAMLCAVYASNHDAYMEWPACHSHASLGVSKDAVNLADAAFDSVPNNDARFWAGSDSRMEMYAEAEAMLRTGWVP